MASRLRTFFDAIALPFALIWETIRGAWPYETPIERVTPSPKPPEPAVKPPAVPEYPPVQDHDYDSYSDDTWHFPTTRDER
jgi:hypothetical protein